jgi:hypothetical protein
MATIATITTDTKHFVPLTYRICRGQTFVRMTEVPNKHENCKYYTGKMDSTLVDEFIDNYLVPKCLYLKQHNPDQSNLIFDLVQEIQSSSNDRINPTLSQKISSLMEKVYDDDAPLVTEQQVKANDVQYKSIINAYIAYNTKIQQTFPIN